MKKLYFLFIFLFIINLSNAQCEITASGSPLQICFGEYVVLNSSGNCEDTIILSNDFNSQTIGSGWTSNFNPIFNNPCGVGDGTPHMWVDTSASYPRYITSPPCIVTDWCDICFDMVYGIEGQSYPCEGPDMPSEGIHLQYSTNGGVIWSDINYWVPTMPEMYSWINLCEEVPSAAAGPNTQFQWYQDVTSGNDQDTWGIDNIQISCPPSMETVLWTNNYDAWTYNDFNPPPQYPPVGTWEYVVTLTGDSYVDSDTITVTVVEPPIIDFTFDNYICADSPPITLSATPSGGTFAGPGVIGNMFYPDSTGGLYICPITYDINSNCITLPEININIIQNPVSTFSIYSACEEDNSIATYLGYSFPSDTFIWDFPAGNVVHGTGEGPITMIWPNGTATNSPYTCSLTVTDFYGCSSTDSISVDIYPIYNYYEYDTICNGDSILWHGDYYYHGVYTDNYNTINGCDSTYTLDLNVIKPYATINPVACGNYTSPSGNNIWSSSGSYLDTIPNASGCDSLITIELTINNSSFSTINPIFCNTYTSPSGNYIWTSTGIYQDTIPNAVGCDSIITLDLTINSSTSSSIYPTVCDNNFYTSPSSNYVWNSSGTYLDTIPNANACDSLITINLTQLPAPDVNLSNDITMSESQTVIIGGGNNLPNYLWNTGDTVPNIVVEGTMGAGTYYYWLYSEGANGCSNIDTIIINVTNSINVDKINNESDIQLTTGQVVEMLKPKQ